ncbi:MED6 mediator sub complex component-domain-containing protein [Trichophaea hybrida]|nr:MED6 mediator sub complex component-domain-containing protein [Trichophaea hybrida]
MAATIPRPRTPIDETLWRDPNFCRHFGPLNVNMAVVMHYFYLSPFFDSTSSNGQLLQQLERNPVAAARIQSPTDFDEALKSFRGTEYVIAAGSDESGVWVIRKQMRRAPREVMVAGQKAKVEDVSIVADYYIIGENIYQAPSVGAVLQNRVLSITRDLRKTLALAVAATSTSGSSESLPQPVAEPSSQQQPPSSSQQQPPSSSQQQQPSTQTPLQPATSQTQLLQDTTLLQRALNLSQRHRGEFMDDHAPLLGDPGSLLQPGAAIGSGAKAAEAARRSGTPVPSRGGLAVQKK